MSRSEMGGRRSGSATSRGHTARLWTFYLAYRPAILLGAGLYLAAVHLLALGLFWQTHWPGVIAWELGLGSRWVEFDRAHDYRVGQLRRYAATLDPGAALFLGDSQLAAMDVGALADHATQLSVTGDTARGVAARVRDYAPALRGARLVVLHVGTNDLRYRPPEALRRPYARILAAVPPGVPVVVTDVLPVDERAFRAYGNAEVGAANRVIAQACAARPGCRFVETAAVLRDAGGGLDPRYRLEDGLHLNEGGNRVWRTALAPVLAPWR